MEIKKQAAAGTLESSDCLVTISPSDSLSLEITSSVEKQYKNQIEKVMNETLSTLGVSKAEIHINDKGALDCTIIARLKAAISRAAETDIAWEV